MDLCAWCSQPYVDRAEYLYCSTLCAALAEHDSHDHDYFDLEVELARHDYFDLPGIWCRYPRGAAKEVKGT